MKARRQGSALVLALVTIVVLSSLVMTFVYRMKLEGELAARYRFRMKSQSLARAGLEWSKLLLVKSLRPGDEEEEYGEAFRIHTLNLSRGLALRDLAHEMKDGSFRVTIQPEQGRRNVNRLSEADWDELLESIGVPNELNDQLVGAFMDWVDNNDLSRLNGAESDDGFYEERGYKVKNAPLDTLDELLLIKGFTRAIVFGGTLREEYEMEDVSVSGLAPLLTVYGDGKVNVNTATREVLLTFAGFNENQVDRLLEGRVGIDGVLGTEDDGFRSPEEAMAYAGVAPTLGSLFTTTERRYVRVTSLGEYGGVRSGVWCIFEQSGQDLLPIFFREEELP
jgi:general secretion pathway protein K